jgi:hypothetical protein
LCTSRSVGLVFNRYAPTVLKLSGVFVRFRAPLRSTIWLKIVSRLSDSDGHASRLHAACSIRVDDVSSSWDAAGRSTNPSHGAHREPGPYACVAEPLPTLHWFGGQWLHVTLHYLACDGPMLRRHAAWPIM